MLKGADGPVQQLVAEGRRFLVHCAAGIGRTGTFATAVLIALGQNLDEAVDTVDKAGSSAQSEEQRRFLARLENTFKSLKSTGASGTERQPSIQ